MTEDTQAVDAPADDARAEMLDVPVAALRPSLEAVLMVADQPLDAVTLATAVGHPVEDVVSVGQKIQVQIAEIDDRGKLSLVPVVEGESDDAPAGDAEGSDDSE